MRIAGLLWIRAFEGSRSRLRWTRSSWHGYKFRGLGRAVFGSVSGSMEEKRCLHALLGGVEEVTLEDPRAGSARGWV